MTVQPGLCRTWSETPKTGFLASRLIIITRKITLQNKRYKGPYDDTYLYWPKCDFCRLHYVNTLKQELDGTRAYLETDTDEMSVVNAH